MPLCRLVAVSTLVAQHFTKYDPDVEHAVSGQHRYGTGLVDAGRF
ncbi:hypothetical protein [Mycobacterium uberis]|nr:hypothetical protein [Mycobacterium uberis]